MVTGIVAAFDDAKGFGTVREDTTGHERFFHCTAIADGSRTIDVGTTVSFEVVPGRNGRWEARTIRPKEPTAE
jgi:CspA family cold shock protein